MAKDILISESSLLYLSKQTKLLQSEDRSVRNLHCTSTKAALLLMQADSLCCDLKKKQIK